MKRSSALFVAAMLVAPLLTVSGCHAERRDAASHAVAKTAANDVAKLPPGSYPEYCVYYPEIPQTPTYPRRPKKPRVAILGVPASVMGGWTTARDVVLSMGEPNGVKYTRCKDEKHFNDGDTLSISPDGSGLKLKLTRSGVSYGPYPLSIGKSVGAGNDPAVLWYTTTGVHAGYRYHVYMVNAPVGATELKQRYWIEAFRVGGLGNNNQTVPKENDDCLNEQPDPDMKNVLMKDYNACPYGLGPQENGIGVGDEPK